MELSDSEIKKFLIFFQKKTFLIFQETELSYNSGKGSPEKNVLYFRKLNFLIFQYGNYYS